MGLVGPLLLAATEKYFSLPEAVASHFRLKVGHGESGINVLTVIVLASFFFGSDRYILAIPGASKLEPFRLLS